MTTRYLQLLALLFWWWFSLGAQAQVFSKIYVFGDSLSDRGNLAALSADPAFVFLDFLNDFPFDKGFSNPKNPSEPGRRAVEILADALGLPLTPSLHLVGAPQGTNFAVAGAVAAGLLPDGGIDGNNLDVQLAVFDQAAPADLENALYVMFIGGNDIRAARDALSRGLGKRVVHTAVEKVNAAVRHLAAQGAKAFLVVNAPNIGVIPESRLLAQSTHHPTLPVRATRYTKKFNKGLSATLQGTREELDLNLVEFDLFHFFGTLLANSRALGFDNSRDACVNNPIAPATPPPIPGCVGMLDSFVFFDEIHPTNHVHRQLGRALFSLVPELPTTTP